jgi:hypothetical protein
MTHAVTPSPRALGLAVLLSCLLLAGPARAAPVTLELSGSIFSVSDAADVFATTIGNTYSIFLTYDPALLPGAPLGDATIYETAPGETAITFSFVSSGGDLFTSDNSFGIRISVENTPPLDPMIPGSGNDRFNLHGNIDAITTLNLVLWESHLGTDPLSSNDLPTTGFGIGPGTWFVSELDIDQMFSNISGSVANIEEVTTVPEPSSLALWTAGGLVFSCMRRRTKGPILSSARCGPGREGGQP